MTLGIKGWAGSIVVHIGIVAAIIGFSWYAAQSVREHVEPVDPILLDLNGIPNKRPGEKEKLPGVAQGDETGTQKRITKLKLPKLDVEKILRDREREKTEQETKKVDEQEVVVKKKNDAGAQPKVPKNNGKKTSNNNAKISIKDFINSKGNRTGAAPPRATIGGASVNIGRSFGQGENGGEGGLASAQALYVGEVEARLRNAWRQVVESEGASVESAGSCGVKLSVNSSGQVAFTSWLTRPHDARMADLVRRACEKIGNCGKPPDNKAFSIDFNKISLSDY